MKKLQVLSVVIVIVLGFVIYKVTVKPVAVVAPATIHDGEYIVDGQKVTLVNGLSEITTVPDSASRTITRYFGNDVIGDIDSDGRVDTAFLVTQTTGGSGTFYYLVGLLDKSNGKVGTQAYFIGDRIAPQTTELKENGIVLVNYADRNSGENFAIQPSVGQSLYLQLDTKTMEFKKVIK